MNVKNHQIYSDKFKLHVLSLNQIELATEEDKKYKIDRWARLFRAKTWEELRMVAQSDNYMSEAATQIYKLNADEIVKEQCRAREEYERHERRMKKRLEEAERGLQAAKQRAETAEQVAENAKQEAETAKQETQNAKQEMLAAKQRIAELERQLEQKNSSN